MVGFKFKCVRPNLCIKRLYTLGYVKEMTGIKAETEDVGWRK